MDNINRSYGFINLFAICYFPLANHESQVGFAIPHVPNLIRASIVIYFTLGLVNEEVSNSKICKIFKAPLQVQTNLVYYSTLMFIVQIQHGNSVDHKLYVFILFLVRFNESLSQQHRSFHSSHIIKLAWFG